MNILHKLITIILVLSLLMGFLLTGCTPSVDHLKPVIATPALKHSEPKVKVDPLSQLISKEIWPLPFKGAYLQKVTSEAQGKVHTFSVHISISPRKLEFVAFNDMVGRVYHLTWTPQKLTWEGSSHIPASFNPENILVDFLLAHLPLNKIESLGLKDVHVSDRKEKRTITDDQGILRNIKRTGPLGLFWKKMTIENPRLSYCLRIETIESNS